MLEALLAGGGLALLRDSVEWEGRSLLKALVKKAALGGDRVHVLGCEVSEEEFREGLGSDANSRLLYHDLFRDPLNWSEPGDVVSEGPLGALRALCRRTDPGPVTVALDSLSWLLFHIPCVTLCQTLHALSQRGVRPGDNALVERVCVLGLLHGELHGPGPLGALSTLAHTESWWFSILPDFSLDLHESLPSILSYAQILTQPRQQALLHPVPGRTSGHIFYEPDAFDDVDQEDPDDDLDI